MNTSLAWPPLPRGTTRHAAAYHPCQPSPPGNVAAFSATPSGVPAAPRHTAAAGEGAAGQVPTQSQQGTAGFSFPTSPTTSFALEVGQGAGKGAAGALTPQG